MKNEKKKELFYRVCEYNRLFILNYCVNQLKKSKNFINVNKYVKKIKFYSRTDLFNGDVIYNKQSFTTNNFSDYGLYLSFIYNNNYYYFQIDNNPFFEGIFYKITLLENKYVGRRYCYTEKDLFKEELRETIKINYFNGFEVFTKYSNKTLLKYAKIYYNDYFVKYFLNIREAERVSEKKRVSNYYNNGYHLERVYDNRQYNIFDVH